MADGLVLPIPNLKIPQNLYILSNANIKNLHADAQKQLLDGIKADGSSLCTNFM